MPPKAGAAQPRGLERPRRPDRSVQTLTQALLAEVGRDIVVGSYDAQPFPTEAELARDHGVSRSVTREAVKMLTAKGLLSARPRLGTVVQPVSAWGLFDPDVLSWILERSFSLPLLQQFTDLRIAIEPHAARLAAEAGDPGLVADVQRSFERMVRAERGEDEPLEADIAFHVAVLTATGNPFYVQFRGVVSTALRTSIRFTNHYEGRTASLPAHEAVCDAIVRRDGEGASRAMRAIISDVMALIQAAAGAN